MGMADETRKIYVEVVVADGDLLGFLNRVEKELGKVEKAAAPASGAIGGIAAATEKAAGAAQRYATATDLSTNVSLKQNLELLKTASFISSITTAQMRLIAVYHQAAEAVLEQMAVNKAYERDAIASHARIAASQKVASAYETEALLRDKRIVRIATEAYEREEMAGHARIAASQKVASAYETEALLRDKRAVRMATASYAREAEQQYAQHQSAVHATSSAYAAYTNQLTATATRYRSMARDATQVGSQMTMYITAPILAADIAAVKFAADFESSMTKVRVLSAVTADETERMGAAILANAVSWGAGPNALAEALMKVTSIGIRDTATAMEVLSVAAKGSAVGMGDVSAMADTLTTVLAMYGKENITAARAADILFGTVIEGKGELASFAGVLGRVAGLAATVGVPFEDLGTYLAVFTRSGMSASEAATALRRTLTGLTIDEAPKTAKVLATVGMRFEDLQQAIKEHGLIETLVKLREKFAGNNEALDALFPNIRALTGVLVVTGAQSQTTMEILSKMRRGVYDLNEGFAVASKTTAFSWAQMRAQFEATAIAVGTDLLPTMRSLLDMARGAASAFSALSPGVRDTVLATGLLVAAFGPAIFLGAGLLRAFVAIVDFMVIYRASVLKTILANEALTASSVTTSAAIASASTVATGTLIGNNGLPIVAAAAGTGAAAGLAPLLGALTLVAAAAGTAYWAIKRLGEEDAKHPPSPLAMGARLRFGGIGTPYSVLPRDPTAYTATGAQLFPGAGGSMTHGRYVTNPAVGDLAGGINASTPFPQGDRPWDFAQTAAPATGATEAFDKAVEALGNRLRGDTGPSLAVVTAAFNALSPAQRESSDAALVLIPILEKWQKLGIDMGPVFESYLAAHDNMTAAGRRYLDAQTEIQSAGENWMGTVAGIDKATREAAESALRAGVSQGSVAEYYRLTDTQVRALTKSLQAEATAETNRIRLQQRQDMAVASMEEDTYEKRLLRIAAVRDKELAADAARLASGKQVVSQEGLIWDVYWDEKSAAELQYERETKALMADLNKKYQAAINAGQADSAALRIKLINEVIEAEVAGLHATRKWSQEAEDQLRATGEVLKSNTDEWKKFVQSIGTGSMTAASYVGLISQALDALTQNAQEADAIFAKFITTLVKGLINGKSAAESFFTAIIGMISDLINAAAKEKAALDGLLAGFTASAGGLANLQRLAAATGVSLDDLYSADTYDKMQMAIARITSELEAQGIVLSSNADLYSTIARLQDEINRLTEANVPTWNDIKDIMERYNIDLDHAGKAIRQMAQDAKALQFITDWQKWSLVTTDLSGLMAGMASQVSQYLMDAIQYGLTIPGNMRPIIEALAAAGQLIDTVTGRPIDITNLVYGPVIETEIDKNTKAIERLTFAINLLRAQLAAANDPNNQFSGIGATPPPTPPGMPAWYGTPGYWTQWNRYYNQYGVAPPEGVPPPWAPPQNQGYASGTGGLVDFGAATATTLHGVEAVLTERQLRSLIEGSAQAGAGLSSLIAAQDVRMAAGGDTAIRPSTGSGGSRTRQTIVVQLNERTLTEAVFDGFPAVATLRSAR
jgi:TP901 family phage tail tape measure protein